MLPFLPFFDSSAAQTVGGYVGPGDVATAQGISQATYFWGLRAYNKTKAAARVNCVDLVDQAFANPITITVLPTGALDIASINTWVTAHTVTTIRVAKVYEQMGSGSDLAPANALNNQMPILDISGLPHADFTGVTILQSGGFSGTALPTTITIPFTISQVLNNDPTNNSLFITYTDATVAALAAKTNVLVMYDNGFGTPDLTNVNNFAGYQATYNGASSVLNVNGTDNAQNLAGTGNIASGSKYRWSSATPTFKIRETSIFQVNFSTANSVAMNANQKAFWGYP